MRQLTLQFSTYPKWVKMIGKPAAAIAKPLGLLMLLHTFAAFPNFVHEEALQSLAHATSTALDTDDSATAAAATLRYQSCMHAAQRWHALTAWANPYTQAAYASYFHLAAPAALAAFDAKGQARGHWHQDIRRWRIIKGASDASLRFVDAWALDPISKLEHYGFAPELMTPEARAKAAGLDHYCDQGPNP